MENTKGCIIISFISLKISDAQTAYLLHDKGGVHLGCLVEGAL